MKWICLKLKYVWIVHCTVFNEKVFAILLFQYEINYSNIDALLMEIFFFNFLKKNSGFQGSTILNVALERLVGMELNLKKTFFKKNNWIRLFSIFFGKNLKFKKKWKKKHFLMFQIWDLFLDFLWFPFLYEKVVNSFSVFQIDFVLIYVSIFLSYWLLLISSWNYENFGTEKNVFAVSELRELSKLSIFLLQVVPYVKKI